MSRKTVVIGSRKSELAMVQTNWVAAELKKHHPEVDIVIETMETLGDKIQDVALSKVGAKALFTKELEAGLVSKHLHLVVHSLKDLPTTLPDGLVIAAMGQREDPRDAVIFHPRLPKGTQLKDLPAGSIIGTSSLRRSAQLKAAFKDKFVFDDVRGNLNTRYRKLEESTADGAEGHRYSALILAAAGVKRMGWEERIGQLLGPEICMHAVGQASVAVECRADDAETMELLRCIDHAATNRVCSAERAFMRTLEGGCSVPLGVSSTVDADGTLHLSGSVHSLDGTQKILKEVSFAAGEDGVAAGQQLAQLLLADGAKSILDAIPKAHAAFPAPQAAAAQ